LNSDRLGKKGEAKFRDLCADAEITCNSSCEQDRTGWDFIVEFDPQIDKLNTSLDRRRNLFSAHVQIKTVWTSSSRVTLRLSSAEFLLKELKPSFIYVITVAKDLSYGDAYIIHLDGPIAEKILKRLRVAERDKKAPNKIDISFDFKRYGKLSSGNAIKREFLECIGNDMAAYIIRKQAVLNSVGYSERPINVSFEFVGTDIERLEDWSTGEGTVQVTQFEVSDIRFGIEISVEANNSANALLRLTPNLDQRTALRATYKGRSAVIEVAIMRTPFRSPTEGGLIKLCHELFELKIRGPKITFKTKFMDPDQRRDLRFWKYYSQFMLFLQKGELLEVKTQQGIFQKLISNFSHLFPDTSFYQNMLEIVVSIEKLINRCSAANLEISMEEISWANAARILAQGLEGGSIPVESCFEGDASPILAELTHVEAIRIDIFAVADKFIAFSTKSLMELRRGADILSFSSNEARLLEVALLNDTNASYEAFIENSRCAINNHTLFICRELRPLEH
jgi:hypothetical protein